MVGADVAHSHVGLEPRLQHLIREIDLSRNCFAILGGQAGVKMLKFPSGE